MVETACRSSINSLLDHLTVEGVLAALTESVHDGHHSWHEIREPSLAVTEAQVLSDVALQVVNPVRKDLVPLGSCLLEEVGRCGDHAIQDLIVSEELVRYSLVEEVPDAGLAEHELAELSGHLAFRVLEDSLNELVLADVTNHVAVEGLVDPLGLGDAVEGEIDH